MALLRSAEIAFNASTKYRPGNGAAGIVGDKLFRFLMATDYTRRFLFIFKLYS